MGESLVAGRSGFGTFPAARSGCDREGQLLQFCGRQSYGNMNVMARKKKARRFGAVQAVKELARERVGAPPAAKVVPHKNKNPAKHKATLGKLLEEAE
jgi:hypothetical protein